jgi:hypothetical protein
MPEIIKDQRKALKTTITNAISVALSKNKHLKDKKVQKAIKNAASEIAKKITKADVVKSPKAPIPATKRTVAKKVVKTVKAVKKPAPKGVKTK